MTLFIQSFILRFIADVACNNTWCDTHENTYTLALFRGIIARSVIWPLFCSLPSLCALYLSRSQHLGALATSSCPQWLWSTNAAGGGLCWPLQVPSSSVALAQPRAMFPDSVGPCPEGRWALVSASDCSGGGIWPGWLPSLAWLGLGLVSCVQRALQALSQGDLWGSGLACNLLLWCHVHSLWWSNRYCTLVYPFKAVGP